MALNSGLRGNFFLKYVKEAMIKFFALFQNTSRKNPSAGKSNGNGIQAQTVPDIAEEDFSNPMVNMDARPAECFHICKFVRKE